MPGTSLELLELNSLLATLKPRVARLLGTMVELVWEGPKDLDPVLASTRNLEEAMLELSMRARQHMPFGGKLLFGGANVEFEDASLCEATLHPGRYVLLEMTCSRNQPTTSSDPQLADPKVLCIDHSGIEVAREMFQNVGGVLLEYSEPNKALTYRAYLPSARNNS